MMFKEFQGKNLYGGFSVGIDIRIHYWLV